MPKPAGRVNLTAAERAKLRRLATVGITRVEAARRLGRSPSMVIRRVRDLGLEWSPPTRKPRPVRPPYVNPHAWTQDDDRRLAELAAAGMPIGLAANQMDRAYNTVLRHSRALGLTWRRDTQARSRSREW